MATHNGKTPKSNATAESLPFEKLYLQERKKSRLFMVTTIIAVIALAGSAILYTKKPKSTVSTTTPPFSQNGMGNGPPGGGFRGMNIKNFIKSDGSVDTDQVKNTIDRLPSEFKDRFLQRISQRIDDAQKNGDITQDQANRLKAAFGVTSSTNAT